MIKQEAAVKTALATDVLLALEELQKVVDSKQNVRLPGVMYTAILWRDGKIHYKGYLDDDQMIWTDGLFIGAISRLEVAWHDRIVPKLDQEWLDQISQVWFSALTGLASNVISTDLAIGRIPAHYGIEGLKINPGRFVVEFAYLSEVNADEAYVDLMETQLETLLAPLRDPGLSLDQAMDFCYQLWTDNNLLEMDLISAIDWLAGKRDISASVARCPHSNFVVTHSAGTTRSIEGGSMSITSQSDCTPVANQFRTSVLRGLDELQKQVTAAGGVGEYISGQVGWTQECDRVCVNVVWNGETIKATEEQYFFEPPSSGWIVLANWDSMYAAHFVGSFGGISLVDQDKLRSRWLEELYPQSMTNDSHLVEQLASGGIPLDIEFEELGINLEALEDICNSAYLAPSDGTHVKAAVALLTYYEDREDSGRVDPLDGPTIFSWLTERGVSGEITSILTHPRRSA